MSEKDLAKQILNRAGQCVMTSPTSALFSGNVSDIKINLGKSLRYFGDGFQIAKKIGDKRYWRIPLWMVNLFVRNMLIKQKELAEVIF